MAGLDLTDEQKRRLGKILSSAKYRNDPVLKGIKDQQRADRIYSNIADYIRSYTERLTTDESLLFYELLNLCRSIIKERINNLKQVNAFKDIIDIIVAQTEYHQTSATDNYGGIRYVMNGFRVLTNLVQEAQLTKEEAVAQLLIGLYFFTYRYASLRNFKFYSTELIPPPESKVIYNDYIKELLSFAEQLALEELLFEDSNPPLLEEEPYISYLQDSGKFIRLAHALTVFGDDSIFYALKGTQNLGRKIIHRDIDALTKDIKASDFEAPIKKQLNTSILQLRKRPENYRYPFKSGDIRNINVSKNGVVAITVQYDKYKTGVVKYFDVGQRRLLNYIDVSGKITVKNNFIKLKNKVKITIKE